MRIESVRFDASGNPTFVVTGGISFFLPLSRVDELAGIVAAMAGDDADAKAPDGCDAKVPDGDDAKALDGADAKALDGADAKALDGADPKGGAGSQGGAGPRAFLERLPGTRLEFSEEDDLYLFLASTDEALKARKKALELCARAEQSSAGLAAKLASRGFSRKTVNAVIRGLKDERILDDERYARVWARGRAERRAAGPALLAAELRSRGQGEGAIRAALEDIDFSRALARATAKEYARMAALWRKKGLELNENFRDSVYRTLKRQGFDPEKIREELERIIQN